MDYVCFLVGAICGLVFIFPCLLVLANQKGVETMKSAMMSIYKQKIKSYAQFITQEAVVLSVIVVNVIVMVALDTQPDLNATVGSWILWVDYACVVYFVFEITVKMLNLGVKSYFSDHWNKLDFCIL